MIKVSDYCDRVKDLKQVIKEFKCTEISFYDNIRGKGYKERKTLVKKVLLNK